MDSQPMMIKLCLLFFVSFSHAAITNDPAPEPEAKVSISIYDLVDKKRILRAPKEPPLGAEYVKKVLSVLNEKQEEVLSCLKMNESLNAKFSISIAPTGEAKVTSSNPVDKIESCISEILQLPSYPKHLHSTAVKIEIPLLVERRIL